LPGLNKILEEILTRHSRIDILKVDIETLERQRLRGAFLLLPLAKSTGSMWNTPSI
jgi:hypothetical protein